jgi:3'-5' exoribonuclease
MAVYGVRARTPESRTKLQLADVHGSIEGRLADQAPSWLRAGEYVGVRGPVEVVGAERVLRVDEIAPLQVTQDDLQLFMPASTRDRSENEAELNALIASIADGQLRTLMEDLLDGNTEVGKAFRISPAAKQNHHAYVGGLLEHTISVARICDSMARHYGEGIDRDLLIAAALLHDIGKTKELAVQPGFPYTDEGKLLGHILLGLQIVAEGALRLDMPPSERLLLLEHLIASHQGRYEWQSPREPRLVEGLLLHYADDLDAKMAAARAVLDQVPAGWTPYDRSFGREFFRHGNDARKSRGREEDAL